MSLSIHNGLEFQFYHDKYSDFFLIMVKCMVNVFQYRWVFFNISTIYFQQLNETIQEICYNLVPFPLGVPVRPIRPRGSWDLSSPLAILHFWSQLKFSSNKMQAIQTLTQEQIKDTAMWSFYVLCINCFAALSIFSYFYKKVTILWNLIKACISSSAWCGQQLWLIWHTCTCTIVNLFYIIVIEWH